MKMILCRNPKNLFATKQDLLGATAAGVAVAPSHIASVPYVGSNDIFFLNESLCATLFWKRIDDQKHKKGSVDDQKRSDAFSPTTKKSKTRTNPSCGFRFVLLPIPVVRPRRLLNGNLQPSSVIPSTYLSSP